MKSAALPNSCASRRRARGFSLIELMIAVAVVALLVAVAMPSYSSYMLRSNRAQAQSFMMSFAAKQQQFLIDTRAYAATVDAVGVPVPAEVSKFYTLAMPAPGALPPSFSLTLTPKGRQGDDACGALSINQAGSKGAAKAGCW